MKIGSMNTKIILQKKTSNKGTDNEPVNSWSDFDEIWANKNNFTGREFFDAQQASTSIEGEYLIRFQQTIYDNRDDLQLKEKASGEIYNIESIIDPENNKESLLIRVNRNE